MGEKKIKFCGIWKSGGGWNYMKWNGDVCIYFVLKKEYENERAPRKWDGGKTMYPPIQIFLFIYCFIERMLNEILVCNGINFRLPTLYWNRVSKMYEYNDSNYIYSTIYHAHDGSKTIRCKSTEVTNISMNMDHTVEFGIHI